MEKFSETVAPARTTDAEGVVASSLDYQSEKDVLTNASGSTYDELKTGNGEVTPNAQEVAAPREEPLEEVLDGKKKVIIVLALCVSLLFFYATVDWNWSSGCFFLAFYFLSLFADYLGFECCSYACFYLHSIRQSVGAPVFKDFQGIEADISAQYSNDCHSRHSRAV